MALAAASAQTWGISDPTFLLAYLLISVTVGGAVARTRRRLADPGATRPVPELADRPHDVAFLHGGHELAVYAALGAMHVRGTVTTSRTGVRAAGRLDPDTDALEKAIHTTAAGHVPRRRLVFHRPVRTALVTIEDRLITSGFLLSEERRHQIRMVAVWMLGVAVLGLVRVLAGVAGARPVGILVTVMLVVAVVATVQLNRAPRRSQQGEHVLAALREQHHELAPEVEPDWRVYGPAGAALGIALFGTSALWASDPGFAEEIGAQPLASTGGTGGIAVSGGDSTGGGTDGGGGGCDGGGG